MSRQEPGFVLITVVLMMTMVMMLVLSNMKLIDLYLKRHYRYHLYQQQEEQFERAVQSLAANVGTIGCRSDIVADEMMRAQLLQQGCVSQEIYRYLIRDLGVYPCVKVRAGQQGASSHHWLLSVMSERMPLRMIQVRIATASQDQICPEQFVVHYHPGIMTWRSLAFF